MALTLLVGGEEFVVASGLDFDISFFRDGLRGWQVGMQFYNTGVKNKKQAPNPISDTTRKPQKSICGGGVLILIIHVVSDALVLNL